MIFYGTSAAEGIPSPFCDSPVCRNARKVGGREVRTRTMFRIDQAHCIDLGADAYCQSLKYGDFVHLKHVLVTHTHEDHLAFMMFNIRNMAISRDSEPLHYYLTDQAYDIVDFFVNNKPILKGKMKAIIDEGIVAFHKLEFHQTYQIGNLTVTPLRGSDFGNMGENAANYLMVRPDGRKMYYGLDTGAYYEETMDALNDADLDIFISECTFGLTEGRVPEGHMDAFSCMDTFRKLYEKHAITDRTKIYLTHINHYTSTHAQLADWFAKQDVPYEITVTYDGYSIP